MVWLFIILIVLLFLGWLLVTPLEICINSIENDYHIKWKGIGEASIIVLPMDLLVRLKIAFWKKDWSVMKFRFKKERKNDKKASEKPKRKKRNARKNLRLFRRILGSFSVKKMRVNIDTQNYILNGYLFPLFFHLTRYYNGKPQLIINYKGKTEINVLMRNRLINIFYAILK